MIIRFTYTGEEIIPEDATHIIVDAVFIPRWAFQDHQNIVEVICSEKVKWIKECAFENCPKLRRVIMPGVQLVEDAAFQQCEALTDVECGELKLVGEMAFSNCKSLGSISLPSATILGSDAFSGCEALVDVKCSNKLETLGVDIFYRCTSLERITIPLKDGLITVGDIFEGCGNLKHVDLVEAAELHETVAALQLEEWRNDMSEEIDSINQILPNTNAGDGRDYNASEHRGSGEKDQAIRRWIGSVLDKINHYKGEHRRILNEAAATLQFALPSDILTNSILPFLELPPHSFGEDEEEEGEDLDVDSQEDSNENGGEEDYLGEERNDNNVEQEVDQDEYDEDETAESGRGKRQRR